MIESWTRFTMRSRIVLDSCDHSQLAFSNRRESHGSRSTDRRMTAHSSPSGNLSRSDLRSQHTSQRQPCRKAGPDLTTPQHIRFRNSQAYFQSAAYSCSNSAQASSPRFPRGPSCTRARTALCLVLQYGQRTAGSVWDSGSASSLSSCFRSISPSRRKSLPSFISKSNAKKQGSAR